MNNYHTVETEKPTDGNLSKRRILQKFSKIEKQNKANSSNLIFLNKRGGSTKKGIVMSKTGFMKRPRRHQD